MYIRLNRDNTDKAINEAIDVLKGGGLIAYPTETFYGLGVKFDMGDSQKRLYELKRRPEEKAMPLIIGEIGLLSSIVSHEWLRDIPLLAKTLMARFWPGPLTLLLPAREGLSGYLTSGTGMVAVRIPGESFALQLARRASFPITATSANPSGMPPADSAEMVVKYFGGSIDLLIDGGQTPGGLPSTIVDLSEGRIRVVREGAVKIFSAIT